MKLFQFRQKKDFGKDYYLTLIQVKRWCFIQSCFSSTVYSRSWPYLNLTMGSGRLLGVSFQVWCFGVTIELISRGWFE